MRTEEGSEEEIIWGRGYGKGKKTRERRGGKVSDWREQGWERGEDERKMARMQKGKRGDREDKEQVKGEGRAESGEKARRNKQRDKAGNRKQESEDSRLAGRR